MSIATALVNAQAKVAAAYSKCNDKGATMPATQDLAHLDDCIDSIPTGGGGDLAPLNDVVFIDYDGTILCSYSAADFANLSAMPSNPSHAGLTAQGWNWTLSDAKSYVSSYGGLVIGQMYVTDDGKTRLHITLDDANYLSPRIYVVSNSTISWGDGTSETVTSATLLTHTYSVVGDYIITLDSSALGGDVVYDLYYKKKVTKVYLGNIGTSLNTYTFRNFISLEEVTIPSGITNCSTGGAFQYCPNLKAIILPDTLTAFGNYSAQGCSRARFISLPNTTTLGTAALGYMYSLEMLCLPETITTPFEVAYFSRLQTYIIPDTATTTTIMQNDFLLKKVRLSNNITSIPTYCFTAAVALTSVTLPTSLTTISQRAFQGAYIEAITIPSMVTSIQNYAFYQAEQLTEVHCLPTTPPSAGTGIFLNATKLAKIYVPTGSLTAYQTASGWSSYASLMEEE